MTFRQVAGSNKQDRSDKMSGSHIYIKRIIINNMTMTRLNGLRVFTLEGKGFQNRLGEFGSMTFFRIYKRYLLGYVSPQKISARMCLHKRYLLGYVSTNYFSQHMWGHVYFRILINNNMKEIQ